MSRALLILLALFTLPAFAQPKGAPMPDANRR